MQISVVTPFFNGSKFFADTVHSLITQTHDDWEWIIVDDGSAQQELETLEAWCRADERIHWQPREGEPKGANRCRNQGWQHASANHILFLDSDDILMPYCLEQRVSDLLGALEAPTDIPYYATVAFKEDQDGRWLWDDPVHPDSWLACLWSQTPPCQSSGPLWTRSALEKIGGWNEEIQVWQDIEIHQRAYFHGFRFIPAKSTTPDLLYRLRESSVSHKKFHSSKKLQSRIKILNAAIDYAKTKQLSKSECIAMTNMTWAIFRNACAIRDWTKADKIIIASASLDYIPTSFMILWKIVRKMRLYKLPFISKTLNRKNEELFPPTKRRIMATSYP